MPVNRIRDLGEVFTPVHIVQEMISSIPDKAWKENKTLLEPTCGEGIFITECIKKRLSLKLDIEIIINEIFGFDIMPDNIEICKNNIQKLVIKEIQKSNLSAKKKQQKFARIICIINNNIRVTEDSLKEDFNNVLYLHEQPKKQTHKEYKLVLELIQANNLFLPAKEAINKIEI